MIKYIDCEAAAQMLQKKAASKYPTPYHIGLLAAARAIESFPAADVRPVEHGVWRKIKYRSICRDCSFRGFASWNYCPNCGRQMATEGENG